MILTCRTCGKSKNVLQAYYDGLPTAVWWGTQGKRCKECRAEDVANRPGAVHRDGPDTERIAAQSIASRTGTLRAQVLALLIEHPAGLTDDEGAALMGRSDRLDFGRRRRELVQSGAVKDSGQRRPTPRPGANPAVVWVLAP